MIQYIRTCLPGDQVKLVGEDVRATVVRITPARAYVRLARGGTVELTAGGVTFRAQQQQYVDWSPATRVELVGGKGGKPVPFWPLIDMDAEAVLVFPAVKEAKVMGILKVSNQDKEQDEPRPMRLLERKKAQAAMPSKVVELKRKMKERKEQGLPAGKKQRARAERRAKKVAARKEKIQKTAELRAATGKVPAGRCSCGCGSPTKDPSYTFARGHYGRYIGMLKQVASGDLEWDDLPKLVRSTLKTMPALKAAVQEHNNKVSKTRRSGGSEKTRWLRKRLKQQARKDDPKTVKAYRKHSIPVGRKKR